MAINVTINGLGQRVIELTKVDGTLILIPIFQIQILEQVDISAWYQTSTLGTNVYITDEPIAVRESLEEVRVASNWNNPLPPG
jgi:hypothetical protein